MMKLKSNNPDFSWIISKNPETQKSKNEPFKKSLRRGTIMGWFNEAQNEFNMFFKDADGECSFVLNGDFEYLDRTRYSSPYLPIAAINELLRSAANVANEKDVEGFANSFSCLVELPEAQMAMRYTRNFAEDCDIILEQLQSRLYKLTFFTEKNIRFLLNCVISFLIVQAIRDENLYIPMEDGPVKKYLDAINLINAGYYFRHSLQLRCIRSPKIYEKFKNDLEANGQFVINHAGSQQHRFEWVKKVLLNNPSKVLHDVGCGELYYTRRMNKSYEHVYAWDSDEEIRNHNAWFIENRIEPGRVTSMGEFSPFFAPSIQGSDVLMTEVLEHIDFETSMQLLETTLKLNPLRVVVTMPNRDFNKFYGMGEGEIRHDDHKFEPSEEEFKEMMKKVNQEGYRLVFDNVGDQVKEDGRWISASMGAVFQYVKGN